ncbi:MAG: hypothetical protein K2X39_05470, partial [Silvanigrellaceae bacterium]|nr:hypothetical protein [Silvanigrellaceae bacterium]
MKAFIVTSLWIAAFIFIFAWILQRQFIYFPAKLSPLPKDYHADDLTVITLLTKDNLSLKSWYKPAETGHPTLLYLHGNAGHIGFRMPLVRQFLTEKMGVLLLEYRGYGGNPGSPTEQGLYNDAR